MSSNKLKLNWVLVLMMPTKNVFSRHIILEEVIKKLMEINVKGKRKGRTKMAQIMNITKIAGK